MKSQSWLGVRQVIEAKALVSTKCLSNLTLSL